nr:MAG TPA: hypothetical protein [Caudoviricetes sp.]
MYLFTFLSFSPFYLILHILGVWQWPIVMDPPIAKYFAASSTSSCARCI